MLKLWPIFPLISVKARVLRFIEPNEQKANNARFYGTQRAKKLKFENFQLLLSDEGGVGWTWNSAPLSHCLYK